MSAAGFGGDAPVLVSAALLKERGFQAARTIWRGSRADSRSRGDARRAIVSFAQAGDAAEAGERVVIGQ